MLFATVRALTSCVGKSYTGGRVLRERSISAGLSDGPEDRF